MKTMIDNNSIVCSILLFEKESLSEKGFTNKVSSDTNNSPLFKPLVDVQSILRMELWDLWNHKPEGLSLSEINCL